MMASQDSQQGSAPPRIGRAQWYYYAGSEVVGPLTSNELCKAVGTGDVTDETWIYRHGWRDWIQFSAYGAEDRMTPAHQPPRPSISSRFRRVFLRDSGLDGTCYVHDHADFLQAVPVDISRTGLFARTMEFPFEVGKQVVVTVKIPGLTQSFNVRSYVARCETEYGRHGYGFQFLDFPEPLAALPNDREVEPRQES